ncbi:MAG: hypothetical protein WDM81_08650 [Rhizomicrobium sp.]
MQRIDPGAAAAAAAAQQREARQRHQIARRQHRAAAIAGGAPEQDGAPLGQADGDDAKEAADEGRGDDQAERQGVDVIAPPPGSVRVDRQPARRGRELVAHPAHRIGVHQPAAAGDRRNRR